MTLQNSLSTSLPITLDPLTFDVRLIPFVPGVEVLTDDVCVAHVWRVRG